MRKIDGQIITNAASPLRLTVTEQDVKKGAPMNPNACAIALAAVRQIPGCTAAKVHKSVLMANIRKKWQRWHVPEYATREIVAFDRGGRFIPQDIIFDPVPVGPPKSKRRSSSSKSSRKRRPSHKTMFVREEARRNEPANENERPRRERKAEA